MGRYRKKPVEIEAIQYTGIFKDEIREFLNDGKCDWKFSSKEGISIATLEGVMTVSPFDWIIKGVAGEMYPCKPDIFEASYEPCL